MVGWHWGDFGWENPWEKPIFVGKPRENHFFGENPWEKPGENDFFVGKTHGKTHLDGWFFLRYDFLEMMNLVMF